MDEAFHGIWTDTVLLITGLGAIGIGLYSIWRYLLMPLWNFGKAIIQLSDAMPVLMKIAHEFKPNNGNSLRDIIDSNALALNNLEQQVEQLVLACPLIHAHDKDRRIIVDYPYIERDTDT